MEILSTQHNYSKFTRINVLTEIESTKTHTRIKTLSNSNAKQTPYIYNRRPEAHPAGGDSHPRDGGCVLCLA